MILFDITGVVALAAVAMSWSFAVVLRRSSQRGSVARRLSLLMVVEGLALATTGSIDALFPDMGAFYQRHSWFALAELMLHALADCGMLVLYPPFLAAALQTPLTRLFADRRMRIAILVGSAALWVALTLPFVLAFEHATPPDVRLAAAPATILYVAMVALFAFAFVASLLAWRDSVGIGRKRARIFAIAFGIRDSFWGIVYAVMVYDLLRGDYAPVFFEVPSWFLFYVLGTAIAVPLIAYGILRTQLFDLDLRIRWTIKQSTLAAVVVAAVWLASEAASQFLSSELGSVVGLLAAAVVMFFLAPLQRFAERVAAAAMPNTHNTPQYAAFRKLQVYEAAVTEALPGGISDKERTLLRHLQQSLGISAPDAAAIEAELTRKLIDIFAATLTS